MGILFLDIETDGLDPMTCNLITLQLRTPSGKSLIIKEPESLEAIKSKLEENLIVGQNLKFDSKFLKYKYGITLYNVYDTMLAEIAISGGAIAGKKGASLPDLVLKYCGEYMDKSEQCGFKKGEDLTTAQENYAVNDLKYLPIIMQKQQAMINYLNLNNVIDTEMRALPAVVWLELSGINIDLDKVNQINNQLIEQREKYVKCLSEAFKPYNVNLNSSKKLKETLNRLEIPVTKTSADELTKFRPHPVIEALLDYKEVNTLITKFTSRTNDFINPVTNRIHANFNQYGAESGRFSCKEPNLQQQPSKFSEWRSIYKATSGNKIITADYSQIELRILGQVSKDKEFIRAYNAGEDLHQLTASKIYTIPIQEVTKTQRSIAKSVNFGLSYGLWIPGLISNLRRSGITIGTEEAEKIMKDYFKTYPSVKKYLWDISEEGSKKFQLYNKAGRLIKFNRTYDKKQLGSIKRQSKNLPIQSLCADIVKIAMANIFLKLEPKRVKFINTVHDELVFEAPEALAEETASIVKEEMEKAGRLFLKDIPCIAEVNISNVWEK